MSAAAPPDPRRWWILAVLSTSLLVLGVDETILNVALPTLERDLGASAGALQWIVDSYLLTFAGLLLTMGALGDRFGRKKSLTAGLLVFGAGSLAAAFSESEGMLIASRALMGAGGALIMPMTLSILTVVFPAHERGKAIGIWAGISGLGLAVGPIAGGFLLEHFEWGSVFFVNLPVVALALVAGAKLIPDSRDPEAPKADPVGAVLSIAGLTALVFALIEAPEAGWGSGQTLGTLAVALTVLAGFVAWELRSSHPMLDVRVFRSRSFSGASGALTLTFFGLMGSIFFLTQHLQGVLGLSALEAGVRMLPIAGGLVISAPLSAVLAARLGTRVTVVLGMSVVTVGLAMFLRADADAGYGPVALAMVLISVGIGTAMAPATESVMSSLPLASAGVGSAMNDAVRLVGGALGVAVIGSVLSSGYRGDMGGAPAAAQDSFGAGLATAERLQDPSLAQAASDAFVGGMHSAAIVAAAVVAAGAVLAAIFLPAREPRGHATQLSGEPQVAAA